MDISQIKILLVEHSNAARCIHTALKTRDRGDLVRTAIEHLELVKAALADVPAESVPDGIDELTDAAIASLEENDLEKGWERLLEMGRVFDDFRRK
jgi:hypothetical protein